MRAMVLAAGVGERMIPLTLTQAKPTIPVLGRPLVCQILEWLHRQGVSDATLNLHHLPHTVQRLVGEGGTAGLPRVHYSYEETILGTAGGLRHAADLLVGEEPIVVCNSDTMCDVDLSAAVAAHVRSGHAATLVLCPHRAGYSVVATDSDRRVISLAGLPPVDARRVAERHVFTGCQLIDEEVIERVPAEGSSDVVRDVYRELAAEGRLGAFLHDGFWWEFGTPETYLEGSLGLIDRAVSGTPTFGEDRDPVQPTGGGHAAVGLSVEVHGSLSVVGRAALGYASRVGEDVVLEDTIVMPEAWIGPGCRLRRVVVGTGAELPAGFRADSELVCSRPADTDTASLPASVRERDGLLVRPIS